MCEMFKHQPPKALAIIPILVLCFITFLWSRDRTALLHTPDLGEPAVILPYSPPDIKLALDGNAHRLLSPDLFLPHFKAVTQMHGMKIAEAKAGCKWSEAEQVDFQFNTDIDWVIRDRSDVEINMRRREWQDFISDDLLPYETYKHRFEGRGIVIVAGQSRSLKRVSVILRALARLGSQLPIELHYWNDEMTEESKQKISFLWPTIYFNDLSAPSNILQTNHNELMNYQLKTAAVINSRFAEPLLLDSDNIPVIDPAELYDSPTYLEYGTIFWPDIARTRPNNPIWPITNTVCRMDEYEQESGQLLVDKRRFFYHLQLAAWFDNEHSRNEYYRQILLGDKDLFRFAWHALQTQYGTPAKWLTSVGTFYQDGYYCGHSFAQHHPDDGRVAFMHGGLVKFIPNELIQYQRDHQWGIYQVYKRSETDEVHAVNVNVGIMWDGGNHLPEELKNKSLTVGSCTDMFDVPAKPLAEIIPGGFEAVFGEVGGYWMLEEE